jgi:tRNA-uridine 2-sulfurtransferase
MKGQIRGLGLSSGGLDSILAGVVLQKQGIPITWISFQTPFYSCVRAKYAAEKLGIPFICKDITDAFLPILKDPACGYGKNANPCRDCHALMVREAGSFLKSEGYDFLFTGEVVGQRPMSQTRNGLEYVDKHGKYEGYLIRPLSAKLLAPSIPEQKGWVDRDQLYGFHGRSRKPQMDLATQLGIDFYPAPAGGCLLTEPHYSQKVLELLRYEKDTCMAKDFVLCRYGRHFRVNGIHKIIVGRDKTDNLNLLEQRDPKMDSIIVPKNYQKGPVVVVPNTMEQNVLLLAVDLCFFYSKIPPEINPQLHITTPLKSFELEPTQQLTREQVESWRV